MPGRATLMGRARPPDATDDTRRLAETGTNNRQRFLGLNRVFREVRCKTVQPESDVHAIAGPTRWRCQVNVRAATYSIRVGSGSLQTRDPRVDNLRHGRTQEAPREATCRGGPHPTSAARMPS